MDQLRLAFTIRKEAQNAFVAGGNVFFRENGGGLVNATGVAATAVVDWYDQQKLQLDNGTVFWKSLASRPVSNAYVLDRGGKNDGIHVAVVDDDWFNHWHSGKHS